MYQEILQPEVITCSAVAISDLDSLLNRYGLHLNWVADGATIPGTYWGDCEAGLVGNQLLARSDTPVHSVLHETCHYICMAPERRLRLHTDAGGDFDEENGVCYLQVVLADELADMGRARMFDDMDTWGYSFRLGSSKAWFERDAEDAFAWLLRYQLINTSGKPTWRLRDRSQ